jgi:hypothetical protein
MELLPNEELVKGMLKAVAAAGLGVSIPFVVR